ncbi:MAG TPA: MBL fold metallo-hydrolase [Lichenihabitans sp.]|jgi:glyoxylase-like metal-dependent hydrolase (beta-lactamase superfamily II)|nr:MBL fold metallo-hydrolase [Lichenihabitans sp.]
MRRLPSAQVPGVYRRDVGDIAVATVNDGMIATAFDHIVGADLAACEAAHRANFRPTPPWLTVNAFLIETADRLMLVDAGYGNTIPEAGRLLRNMAALGVEPDDIDAVLMTHLHADHDAGLVTGTGTAVFRRAELVVHEDELAFWRDDGNIARLSEGQKVDFALATAVLAAYADRIRPVRAGDVGSGVSAVPTPGHTPGHTAWRVASGDEQLLIWGDVIHLPGIQFAIPEASVIYDLDSAAAAAARRRVLDMVSADRIPVAGIHLDFPGYGRVKAEADGRFAYVADVWTPVI